MQRLILSTVGISLLLNQAEPEWRKRLNELANERALPDDVQSQIERLAAKAAAALRQHDVRANRRLSAELNGVYGIYAEQLARGRGDMHYLIATDTVLGMRTAQVLRDYMAEQGLITDVYAPERLNTGDKSQFSEGIKKLINWCETTLPGFRERGYRVIFNLTAGFKGLQGYLSIIGMFYADDIVYIFESSDSLLTIPRLPIQIDVQALRAHRVELAMMAQGHIFSRERVQDVPEGLLDVDGDAATLSDWGLLVWNRVRDELLNEELLPFPRLQYRDSFRSDFRKASAQQRARLQNVLAEVSSLLESSQGDMAALKRHGGLQYDLLVNRTSDTGRPIGHFRISQGERVTCTAEDGALRLRRFGEHAVNDNP